MQGMMCGVFVFISGRGGVAHFPLIETFTQVAVQNEGCHNHHLALIRPV